MQQLTSHSFALDVTVKCTSACVLFRSVVTAKADQQMDEGRVSSEGGAYGGRVGWEPLAASPPSDEPPHLQFHDSEVVGFREAAVVEGVAGAATAQVQVLVHPQSKVAAAWDKDLFICIHPM